MEAGECGRTRGTCFITCRLEVVAVAGLLCFRGVFSVGRIFCVFFFRFFLSFERTRPTASMRPPCLIYVSSSNSVAVFTCAILISCFLRKTTKKTNKNKRFPLLMLICCYCYVFCCRSRQRAVAVQFVSETTVGGWRLRAASLGWVGRVIESWFWPGIFSSVCVGARAAVKLLPNARMLWYLTETSVRIIASWFFRQNVNQRGRFAEFYEVTLNGVVVGACWASRGRYFFYGIIPAVNLTEEWLILIIFIKPLHAA